MWEGVYQDLHALWPRFYDQHGQLVPTAEEAERQRAEEQTQRANAAEAALEALRREQGPSANPAATAAPDEPILPAGPFDIPFWPLRRWRQARAAALGQPEYVVFSDETLRRLAQKRPTTPAELQTFAGLGAEPEGSG